MSSNNSSPESEIRNPQSEIRNRKGIGGPKTAQGKKRSSLNALKHGLLAKSPHALAAAAEYCELDDFPNILEEMESYYKPKDPVEVELVHRIALCVWRLAYTEGMERRNVVEIKNPTIPNYYLMTILRYERLVDIHLHRAIRALQRKRAEERIKK